MIVVSVVGEHWSGCPNLAIAIKSLLSLYNPIEVRYGEK